MRFIIIFFNIFIICEVIPLFGFQKGSILSYGIESISCDRLFGGCAATECREHGIMCTKEVIEVE